MDNNKPLLEVKGLKTYFYTEDGVVRAVDGVDLEVYPGEVLGIVGESGCGKSVTSLSIMRLISKPGSIEAGEILLDGENLLEYTENEMIKVRGNRISMIFQQPQTALTLSSGLAINWLKCWMFIRTLGRMPAGNVPLVYSRWSAFQTLNAAWMHTLMNYRAGWRSAL